MSVKLMSIVWELDLDHSTQKMLLALADHADDDGSHVYPSIEYLAWKTSYSRSQVLRILKLLRDDMKALEVVREGGGRGNTTEYKLNLDVCDFKEPYDGPNRLTEVQRRRLLLIMLEKYERCCALCGEEGGSEFGPDNRPWHLDRIVTGRHGGRYTEENVRLACCSCNIKRHRAPKHKKGVVTTPLTKGENTETVAPVRQKGVAAMTPEPLEPSVKPTITSSLHSEVMDGQLFKPEPSANGNGHKKKKEQFNPVSYLLDQRRAAVEAGKHPSPFTRKHRGSIGDEWKGFIEDGVSEQHLRWSLDYLIAKCCGEINGYKGWVQLHQALDAVLDDNWRPKGAANGSGMSEELKAEVMRKHEEAREIFLNARKKGRVRSG